MHVPHVSRTDRIIIHYWDKSIFKNQIGIYSLYLELDQNSHVRYEIPHHIKDSGMLSILISSIEQRLISYGVE